MDAEKSERSGLPNWNSTSMDEPFSIDSLIKRVEEFQQMEELETLKEILSENSSLKQRIIRYHEHWCLTLDLLHKSHQALISMQDAFNKCLREEAAAERHWLTLQGIKKNSRNDLEYSLDQWI